jgi:hypothetical protein
MMSAHLIVALLRPEGRLLHDLNKSGYFLHAKTDSFSSETTT